MQCRYSPVRPRSTIKLSALCENSQFASPALRKALGDLAIQCRYSHIRHPQSNPTERFIRDLAIREPCMAESADRFRYPVHVLSYPPAAKQPFRARYARAFNSRALHGGKRWPIMVCSAGTPYQSTAEHSYRARCAQDRNSLALHGGKRLPIWISSADTPLSGPANQSYRVRYARARNSQALHGGNRWPIWLSSADNPLSATHKAILPSAIYAISQFTSPAWRKALADFAVQFTYSHLRHP
jgi:hypothetical protein